MGSGVGSAVGVGVAVGAGVGSAVGAGVKVGSAVRAASASMAMTASKWSAAAACRSLKVAARYMPATITMPAITGTKMPTITGSFRVTTFLRRIIPPNRTAAARSDSRMGISTVFVSASRGIGVGTGVDWTVGRTAATGAVVASGVSVGAVVGASVGSAVGSSVGSGVGSAVGSGVAVVAGTGVARAV